METKIYQCNEELASIFKNIGFAETTNLYDSQRGKKEFRKNKSSRFIILFDRTNFSVFEGSKGCNVPDRPTADELRLLIWYINSSPSDREIISIGCFDINEAKKRFETILSLTEGARELNISTIESRKFERMLNNHDAISLS